VTNGDSGHLWKTGFAEGHLKTPLFDDVVPTLEAWKKAGKKLAIFSSGSVQAQLQFFSYVKDGETTRDIKSLFSAHYDTVNAGPKMEKASYQKICSELGCDVSRVTFLTDNVKGKKCYRRIRPLNRMLSPIGVAARRQGPRHVSHVRNGRRASSIPTSC
jgi:2,3-diketo-5-methylthio-1-phosphopentane phosphatase